MGGHETQERYSKLIDVKLRNTLTLKDGVVFNTRYEGTPTAGAVKVPVRDTEVAVSDYDLTDGTDATRGATSYETILIDKDKAVNELIDGYEASAVPDNLQADRLDSAGYSLGLQLDKDGAGVLEAKGTKDTDKAPLTEKTIYSFFVKKRTAMAKLGVPAQGRFAIVTPETYALLLTCPEFLGIEQIAPELVKNGVIGRIAGFNIIENTYLSETTEAIFGHPNWCHRVKEWKEPVKINDIKDAKHIGACAVQGRMVYGYAVTKPQTLLVKSIASV